VSNVWALSPDDRRRMIRAAVRERYESAMDDLKDSIRQYNMIREIYEVQKQLLSVHVAFSYYGPHRKDVRRRQWRS
jgi:hypothetical protein